MSEDAAGTEEPPEVEGDEAPTDDGVEGADDEAEGADDDAATEAETAEARLAALAGEVDEDVGEELAALSAEVADLRERAERADDLESRLKRKQAEFENYKKRQKKRREHEQARATEDLVTDLLEVRDNLSRALEQDADVDIREGVEATFRSLEDVLAGEGVEPIEPDPGTQTDPERHEVLLRVESDQPEGTVADLHRPGYEMAEKVLRAAQVTVSDGSDAGDGGGDDGGEGDGVGTDE